GGCTGVGGARRRAAEPLPETKPARAAAVRIVQYARMLATNIDRDPMTVSHRGALTRSVREFCGAVFGAQCLVARGELGPRVSALMRYAGTLLDAIDVQLLEAGLPADASELAAAAR